MSVTGVFDEGWEALNFDKEAIEEVNQKARHHEEALASLFWRVFNTEDGKELLAELRAMTIEADIMPLDSKMEGSAISMFMAYREGENKLVKTMEHYVKLGEELLNAD